MKNGTDATRLFAVIDKRKCNGDPGGQRDHVKSFFPVFHPFPGPFRSDDNNKIFVPFKHIRYLTDQPALVFSACNRHPADHLKERAKGENKTLLLDQEDHLDADRPESKSSDNEVPGGAMGSRHDNGLPDPFGKAAVGMPAKNSKYEC